MNPTSARWHTGRWYTAQLSDGTYRAFRALDAADFRQRLRRGLPAGVTITTIQVGEPRAPKE